MVGARINGVWSGFFYLLIGSAFTGYCVYEWQTRPASIFGEVFLGVFAVIGLLGVLAGIWVAFGWFELQLSGAEVALRTGIGPVHRTRRMAAADVRKVERVDTDHAKTGKPLYTTLYVFGTDRTWAFGRPLRRSAIDHLWRDLSAGRASSRRTKLEVPSSD